MKPKRNIFIVAAALLAVMAAFVWWQHTPGTHETKPPVAPDAKNTPSPTKPVVSLPDQKAIAAQTAAFVQLVTEKQSIPDSVKAILTVSATGLARDRVLAAHNLTRPLSREEIVAFYQYLLTPEMAVPPYSDGEHWLRNELLDKLAAQPVLPADLTQLLVAMHQDTNQNMVMRDYAIQHMTPIYEREDGSQQALLQATLWLATQESDSGIAGTALLALQQLAQTDAGLEQGRIGETALKLAGNPRSSDLARITAIQVCGRLAVTQAGPEALALAQDASRSTPLRLAAIATLGELGGVQAKPVLQQIAGGSEPRLKPAALAALQHLTE